MNGIKRQKAKKAEYKGCKDTQGQKKVYKEVQHARNELESKKLVKKTNIYAKASSLLNRLDLRMKSIVDSNICLLSLAVSK